MPPPRWKYFLPLALLVLLTTVPARPLQARETEGSPSFYRYNVSVVTTTATIVPAEHLYWPGDTATVALALNVVTDLYGFGGTLAYDTTRLHFNEGSLTPGLLLDDGSTTTSEDDVGVGSLAFSAQRTSGNGATGSGGAVTMTFAVKNAALPGKAAFSLSELFATDPSGTAIPLVPVDSFFRVGGVWPGDTDNNCTVEPDDVLPLGAHFGETGPPRPGGFDLTWGAKAFHPWGGASTSPAFSKSFLDATGDGVIDHRDVLALGINRGAQHGAKTGCTPPGAGKHTRVASLWLDPQPVGTVFTVALDLAGPASALLGTAFKVAVDPSVLKLYAVTASALLDDGDLMKITHLDPEAGTGAAAFTRKGTERAVGEGSALAVLTLEVVGEMAEPSAVSLSEMKLSTMDAGIIEASEQAVVLRLAEVITMMAGEAEQPNAYVLESAYPNPFNPTTTLRFSMPEPAQVRLVVYDVLGRQVRVLVDSMQKAGTHDVIFEANGLPSGTYLMRLVTPTGSFVKTMQLVK